MLDDARWGDARDDGRNRQASPLRERHDRDHDTGPRDAFARAVDLPRGRERAVVHDARGLTYRLRGSESRTLSTVGAFRVVPASHLLDHSGRPLTPRTGDLRHLREQGLVETVDLPGRRDAAVVLTERGRDLLEGHHAPDRAPAQQFYAGLKRERECEHDVRIFEAYLREAERLAERGAEVDRVVLDFELKRDYQRWLHERDRDLDDFDGRPDRDAWEIEAWARENDLPYFDDQVHFPDLRIEYREADESRDHVDVEIVTPHYRGAHSAAVARSGFSCHRGSSLRLGGRGGGRRGGGRLGGLAGEFFR